MTIGIILLALFWKLAVVIYCVTHSLAWNAYWSQRAHKELGQEWDVRWNTGRLT